MAESRFDGRVAVVTGAGRGMGRAHAEYLAARGAAVVVNDIDPLDEVVTSIREAGGTAHGVRSSVASSGAGEALVEAAIDQFGRFDILVSNAGILRSHPVTGTTDAIWDEVLGVNLRGGFALARAAWPVMEAQGYGRMVFITSNSGLLGVPGSSAYAASKAGLWGVIRVLSLEGGDVGIGVNGVAPLAYTDMAKQSVTAPRRWRSGEGDAWSEVLTAERVSPVVAWLSHEACPLTGEVLSVGGGRVARFFMGLTNGIIDDEMDLGTLEAGWEALVAEDGYQVFGAATEENRHLYRRLMDRPR